MEDSNGKESALYSSDPSLGRKEKADIYCRVSTNDMEQLNSLKAQISALTRMVSNVEQWRLVDVYIDIASAKTKFVRKDFARMIEDCKAKKTGIIITKKIEPLWQRYCRYLRVIKGIERCRRSGDF